MTLQDWKTTGHYFLYKNKHRIFYQQAGEEHSEVLLLLHGFPTASWDWHKIWPRLTKRFKVIAPDFIGFGYSDKPQKYTYSIFDQADLVEALMNSLGSNKVHIFAHDYGDTVLQELLARQIERKNSLDLKSICLLNGGIFYEMIQARPIQKALLSPFGFLLTPFLNKNSLRKNFKRIFGPQTQATEQEIDEFYDLMDYQNGKRNFHKIIRYLHERKNNRDRWVNALINCPVPLRLIIGALDPISGQHMADRFNELVPNPNVVILPNIGHYPQTEAPKEIADLFLDFPF